MDDVKRQQLNHWDDVASGWAAWLAWTERNFAPITNWLTRTARWAPGVYALDTACGPGYPAFAAASRLHPGGSLIATDLSPAMIAAGSERARATGIENIEFLQMDAEDLRFADEAFDTVSNAYGLMFCPAPDRALAEAFRVLKRGGRLAVVVWDERSNSPFFDVIASAAAPLLKVAPPAPLAPGPFRLASSDMLASLLETAGFADVQVERCAASFECASVDAYCQLFNEVAWKNRIAKLSDAERASYKNAVRDGVEPFVSQGTLRLPATSLCASGRKA